MKENEKLLNNESKIYFIKNETYSNFGFFLRLIFNELLNTERAYVDSLSKCIQVS